MLLVFLLFFGTWSPIRAREAMYEGFEQLNGTDFMDYQLRVTKLNRSTAALIGSIFIKKPITSDVKVHVTVLHSAKGNQQFNHYPMKVPPIDFCSFTTTFWPDYVKYYEPYMENIFGVGECPVEPREIRVNKHVLDGNMFPQYLPTGLWKLIVEQQNGVDEDVSIAFTMRFFDDGFFG